MKTITIKVPNWFPTRYELEKYKRKFIKWLFPPRCTDCNKPVKTSGFYWKQYRTGTHPLGIKNTQSDFAIRSNRPSCARCMKWFIHNLSKEIGNCTICEAQNVPVIGYTFSKEQKSSFTFLWHWWNGSTFCMKCIDELLDNGEPASDIYRTVRKNGKWTAVPDFY